MANFQIFDAAGRGIFLQPGRFWSDLTISLGTTTYFEFSATPNGQILYREYGLTGFYSFMEMTPLSGSVVNTPRVTVYNSTNEVVFEVTGLFTPWDLDVPAPLSPERIAAMQNNADLAAVFGLPAAPVPEYRSNQDLLEDALSGSDLIIGNSFADTINSGSGNDTIQSGGGSDIVNGGAGVDTSTYTGNQNSYSLVLSPNGTAIGDRRDNGDGIDELINIELLDFSTNLYGSPFDLRQFGGPTTLTGDQLESFIELYIAYFNRAPDAVGLNFWGTAFANGTTLEQMASLFVGQPETLATYPEGTSNQDFATSVYNNVLGRTPDQAGIDFWVGLLDSGGVRRDEFILRVLEGAKADLKPEEGQAFVDQQLEDRAYLENKTDIGAYFAVHRGMSDLANAAAAMALFDGTASSVNSAVAAIDAYFEDALDPINGEFLMPLIGVLDDPFSVA